MKSFKLLLLSTLLVASAATAMTSKVKEPTLAEGTSVGKYQKPGAPVDIHYTTQHVEIGEKSEVHIVLNTAQRSGTLNVTVNVDKDLQQLGSVAEHLSFQLKAEQKEYPLDLTVMAENDGLYYIRVLVSIKGKGMRAFAVPVYVGEGKLKKTNKAIQKTSSGENISVSPAVETIER